MGLRNSRRESSSQKAAMAWQWRCHMFLTCSVVFCSQSDCLVLFLQLGLIGRKHDPQTHSSFQVQFFTVFCTMLGCCHSMCEYRVYIYTVFIYYFYNTKCLLASFMYRLLRMPGANCTTLLLQAHMKSYNTNHLCIAVLSREKATNRFQNCLPHYGSTGNPSRSIGCWEKQLATLYDIYN